jgi:redox-sensing transcriptional repressor
VARLSLYRRILSKLQAEGRPFVYSHQLAAMTGATAVQVRRDLMDIGYSGSPNRGYAIAELIKSISEQLDDPQGQGVALVGLGNLGRAIIGYAKRQNPSVSCTVAFDKDPEKFGTEIDGCPCYSVEQFPEIARERRIQVGIIATPASAAQEIAEVMVASGITGILNFAPATLKVPEHVFVENMDVTISLERVAYFARQAKNVA